jgi:[acyl-carrier-protein] S-malonyltransferase
MASTRVFAMFPGQGSQHVGMAKDLCENFTVAREVFEEASEAVKKDLKKLCFDGPESDLKLTENTQPCLLTASVAAFRVASSETGFSPAAVAGHSLGEYSALVAAGALPLATAAYWVKERGRAMQSAVPVGQGGMAAVMGLDDEAIAKLCARATELAKEKRAAGARSDLAVEACVEPANFNDPGQTVIAGSADAIDEAVALIKAGEFAGKAIPLAVSAPFHCRLMRPARERMAELFSQAPAGDRAKTPSFPYFPNRTARLTREPGLVFEFLIEQVDHPVLWKQTVASMVTGAGGDYTHAIEFGPGKVLQGLVKRGMQAALRDPGGKTLALAGVSDTATLRAAEPMLKG